MPIKGRFSQTIANVLARIASGDMDFYPGEYVPFGDVVEEIRREVSRLGGSGHACDMPLAMVLSWSGRG